MDLVLLKYHPKFALQHVILAFKKKNEESFQLLNETIEFRFQAFKTHGPNSGSIHCNRKKTFKDFTVD